MKFTKYIPEGARTLIEACISKYGFAPEHTYDCFVHSAEDGWKSVFLLSEEGYGVMAYFVEKDNEWNVLSEPLAPPETRAEVATAFFEYALSVLSVKAVYAEFTPEVRKGVISKLSPSLRARRVSETLIWPVLDLSRYDSSLSGSRMKPMRNVQNRFLREHVLEVVDATSVNPAELHALIDVWKKNRPAKHRAYAAEYHALVDERFSGTTGGRVFLVDGKPEAMSAGWLIPNSDTYYHSLALHTYRHWGLGEMMMLKSLEAMKKDGYTRANLGGSDKNLLSFKSKFGDIETYATQYFSVVRR